MGEFLQGVLPLVPEFGDAGDGPAARSLQLESAVGAQRQLEDCLAAVRRRICEFSALIFKGQGFCAGAFEHERLESVQDQLLMQ